MKVDLKCFANLTNNSTCNYKEITTYEMDEGQTVENLIQRAEIDRGDVKIAFVNSRTVDLDTVLSDNDRVGLAPAVGGM